MDGFFLIDKPAGYTSFDVCACTKKHCNIKKVGHTGTLDPFATGLLVVAVGKGTKCIPYLEKASKTYLATIVLGKTSETLDTESEIVELANKRFEEDATQEDIQKVIDEDFIGEIDQIPPKYSALKINGKRAYDLARQGIEVEMKVRKTFVHRCDIVSYTYPELKVELEVSAGFYVRSFARDMGGYCSELRRTKVGDLDIADAEDIKGLTMPIDPQYILKNLQHIEIKTGNIQDFMSGRAFPCPGVQGERVLVLCGGQSVGIGEFVDGNLQPRGVL
ncbi:UNVERIFIED_CONTAM: hypothetical protein GTU68_051422 [Idotea baltica]|nr:hypothetical protein [Idotea baltica]